jgi:5-(carboxyamino)imidazole ribonucleotide synthase
MLACGSTIGIIGGGQLGRMLAMAAARFGYRVIILDPQADCPAAQCANGQIVAAYGDADGLAELARRCDVITYEFENVPVDAARLLAGHCPVRPGPVALEMAQDRVREKSFLNQTGLATAPWRSVATADELNDALVAFGGQGILKTRRLGYDGKGQLRLSLDHAEAVVGAFAVLGDQPVILEGLVPFVREISVIAARGNDGATATFDIAENVHRGGILHSSTIPASISPETAARAKAMAVTLLQALDYVGVLGLELFVLADGDLLANEFAPRVHNSGHWTEAACPVSQFEQHIRAVAGLPLGDTSRHSDCVMENLLGEAIHSIGALAGQPGVVVHDYGKAGIKPGRKMGHFTRLLPRLDADGALA